MNPRPAWEADADRAGVTRTSRIDRLDVLGVPVVSAVRSTWQEGNLAVSSGAGRTPRLARRSALAEAAERYAGEDRGHVASQGDGPRVLDALHPTADVPVARWIPARGLLTGASFRVPDCAVFLPLPEPWPLRPTTTGMAYGTTLAQAVLSGLLECIERDTETWFLCRLQATDKGGRRRPSPLALPADVAVTVSDITGELGVPTCIATLREDTPDGPWQHQGTGCASSLAAAATKAILEAAQSRAVEIQGARADFVPGAQPVHPWYRSHAPEGPTTPLPGPWPTRRLLRRVRAVAGHEPLVVDLTPTGWDGHVVRVICPGLEDALGDPERIGPRADRWLG